MPGEYAICVGTFYEDLAERLVNGAVEGFAAEGVSAASVHTYEVPGAFELPLAAKWCAESGRFAGVACLGAVIRGETDHYDYVAGAAATGIANVALSAPVPVIFGVLTCDTVEQALNRAGMKSGNKGFEAALTAIEMVHLLQKLPRKA